MTKGETRKYEEFLEGAGGDERVAWVAWLKWKALTDLFYLGYEILGYKEIRDKNGRRIIDPKFHRWLCDVMSTQGSKLVLVPRRHAKTLWARVKVVQEFLRNANNRTGLFSVTSGLVEASLASIVQLLQNPLLMDLFPERIPRPGKLVRGRPTNWMKCSAEALTVKREEGEGQPQEAQIEAYGVGSTFTGKHFDFHLYDDLLDKDTVKTPEQLRKTEEWYSYTQAVLEPMGEELMLGTPYHYADLYARIMESNTFEKVVMRPCIEDGRPIYSYFTLEMLDRLKRKVTMAEGAYMWSTQWMCDPVPREDQIFPPPQPMYSVIPPEKMEWYIAVDPAATTNSWSDETAFAVAGVNPIGLVHIEECFGVKKKGDEIARIILQLNERYKPKLIGVEFGTMKHLEQIIGMVKSQWEQIRGPIALPLVEIRLDSQRRKFDRINMTLGSFVRAKRVKINSGCRGLMAQMEKLTPNYQGKDDLVDAASMLFQIIPAFATRAKGGAKDAVLRTWFTFEELAKRLTQKKKGAWAERSAV